MRKLDEYVNTTCIIYANTPIFPHGAVVRVLGYDSTSGSEVSFLVIDLRKDASTSDNLTDFNSSFNTGVWVKFEDIKEVINFTRIKSTFINRLTIRVQEWMMRNLRGKSSVSSGDLPDSGVREI